MSNKIQRKSDFQKLDSLFSFYIISKWRTVNGKLNLLKSERNFYCRKWTMAEDDNNDTIHL